MQAIDCDDEDKALRKAALRKLRELDETAARLRHIQALIRASKGMWFGPKTTEALTWGASAALVTAALLVGAGHYGRPYDTGFVAIAAMICGVTTCGLRSLMASGENSWVSKIDEALTAYEPVDKECLRALQQACAKDGRLAFDELKHWSDKEMASIQNARKSLTESRPKFLDRTI